MWSGMDPETRAGLEHLRQIVKRAHQTPTREWSLVFLEECDAVLVIREWPGGTLTASMLPVDRKSR
jgi:hypothetical protein